MEFTPENSTPVLNLLRHVYGYDFTGYNQKSLKRRLQNFARMQNIDNKFDFIHLLLNNLTFPVELINNMTVHVTEMFRDPQFYKSLAENVLPILKNKPSNKIWHAGCSTGQEVYSMKILLEENNLAGKTKIYATDINDKVLAQAYEGVYDLHDIKTYTKNYLQAGGKNSLSNYYTANYNEAILASSLKKDVVFAKHNLATQGAFDEFDMIVCRNVLIYFSKNLQQKTIETFYNSLAKNGILALGTKETLSLSGYNKFFEPVDEQHKIYRKI